MAFFFWKRKRPELRQIDLPGSCGTVCVPVDFITDMENPETLLTFPRGTEAINLRFSSISFTKEGEPVEHAAQSYLRQKAADQGLEYRESNGKAIVCYESEDIQDGIPH